MVEADNLSAELVPVFGWSDAVFFLEASVEIRNVGKTYCISNFRDVLVCAGQQVDRGLQAESVEVGYERFVGRFLKEKAEGIFVHGDMVCHLVESDFPVIIFDYVFIDSLHALPVLMDVCAVEFVVSDDSAVFRIGSQSKDVHKT